MQDFAKARGEGASPRGEGWAQGTGDLSRIGYALGGTRARLGVLCLCSPPDPSLSGTTIHLTTHLVREESPVTKNGRTPSAKREDASSNSEVHLSEIEPAQVEKYKGQKSRFRTGDLPLAEGSPARRALRVQGRREIDELAAYVA